MLQVTAPAYPRASAWVLRLRVFASPSRRAYLNPLALSLSLRASGRGGFCTTPVSWDPPPPRPSYPPRPHRWFGEDARLSSKAATVICPAPAFRADRLKGCSKLRSPSQRQPSGLLRPSFLLSSFLASIPLSGKAAFPNCTLTPCTYFPGSLEPPFYHKPCPSLSPSSSAPRLGCIQQTYFMC